MNPWKLAYTYVHAQPYLGTCTYAVSLRVGGFKVNLKDSPPPHFSCFLSRDLGPADGGPSSIPPLVGGVHVVGLLASAPHPALDELLVLGGDAGLLLLGDVELQVEGEDLVLDLLEHLLLAAQLLGLVPDAQAQGVPLGGQVAGGPGLRPAGGEEGVAVRGGLAEAGLEGGLLPEGLG